MKRILIAVSIVLAWPVAAASGSVALAPADRVEAVYFHGRLRCESCLLNEDYTKQALATYFRPELDSGKLVFAAVNVQEKENAHFIEDYQLNSWSLVIRLVRGGREVKHKKLERIWELLDDRGKFMAYVRDEVKAFLEGP